MHPLSSSTLSSSHSEAPPQLFCLHPGQHHALAVPAGSELFCAAGSVLLHSGPQGLIDGLPSLQWQLSTGQRWRAPCTLWLQVSALGAAARVQCSMAALPAALPAAAPAPATLWQRLGALRHAGRRRTLAG